MKQVTSLALTLVALGCASAEGVALQTEELKHFIRNLCPQTARALKTQDSRFFDQLLAPNFVAQDERGVKLGRKEALFVIRFQLNTLKVLDYRMKIQSVKLVGSQATVVSSAKLIGLTQPHRGHPGSKVEITRKVSEVYEKSGTHWLLIYKKDLAVPTTKILPATKLTSVTAPKR